jgi:hypothetical protein
LSFQILNFLVAHVYVSWCNGNAIFFLLYFEVKNNKSFFENYWIVYLKQFYCTFIPLNINKVCFWFPSCIISLKHYFVNSTYLLHSAVSLFWLGFNHLQCHLRGYCFGETLELFGWYEYLYPQLRNLVTVFWKRPAWWFNDDFVRPCYLD